MVGDDLLACSARGGKPREEIREKRGDELLKLDIRGKK
uniref:Uncharacterized protein n=1 Tax=Setaria viridis TaxID=4556 RepID=A0A4U6UGS8_SETVI|nr:hypothetical protein SEVIR_5G235350v2 [Setaria viridis]